MPLARPTFRLIVVWRSAGHTGASSSAGLTAPDFILTGALLSSPQHCDGIFEEEEESYIH
jgi:hypothetical protein